MIIIKGGILETEVGRVYWDIDDNNVYHDSIIIYNLKVYDEYRNKGFGKLLLTTAISFIKIQYPDMKITIEVKPDNSIIDKTRLTNFYKSMGLVVL